MALTFGPVGDEAANGPRSGEPVLVYVHAARRTWDLFGSRRCDCGERLEESLSVLQKRGCGVLLYLRQEGRGIGLTKKMYAYTLQEQGLDTVGANIALGLPEDACDYLVAAGMLSDLDVSWALVLTNNPAQIERLRRYSVEVVEWLPLPISPNPPNTRYLHTKREKVGIFSHEDGATRKDSLRR